MCTANKINFVEDKLTSKNKKTYNSCKNVEISQSIKCTKYVGDKVDRCFGFGKGGTSLVLT